MKKQFSLAFAIAAFATALSASAASPASTKTPQTLASGVVITTTVVAPADAKSPKATDVVKVHYKGTLKNGTEFDSSYKRGAPATFPLNRVIPCWTEAVQKMKVGEKATLFCPAKTAYGAQGAGALIAPNTDLNFEVELLGIQ